MANELDVMEEAKQFLSKHGFVTPKSQPFSVADVTTIVAAAIVAFRPVKPSAL